MCDLDHGPEWLRSTTAHRAKDHNGGNDKDRRSVSDSVHPCLARGSNSFGLLASRRSSSSSNRSRNYEISAEADNVKTGCRFAGDGRIGASRCAQTDQHMSTLVVTDRWSMRHIPRQMGAASGSSGCSSVETRKGILHRSWHRKAAPRTERFAIRSDPWTCRPLSAVASCGFPEPDCLVNRCQGLVIDTHLLLTASNRDDRVAPSSARSCPSLS